MIFPPRSVNSALRFPKIRKLVSCILKSFSAVSQNMKTYLQTRIDALEKMHGKRSESHQANLNLMLQYIQYRKNLGFSDATMLNDVKALIVFSKSIAGKPITELNQTDMYTFFDSINKTKASAVLHRSKISLFLRHVGRDDLAGMCKMKVRRSDRKLPEDMLTQEEIEQLIGATHNLRDAAFIALLYESGARRGELLELQLKHIVFDAQGAVITLPKGKTGPRRIRVVFAASYLRNWFDHHPERTNRNSPVWASLRDSTKIVGYTTFVDMLQRAAKQAGITKRVNMHNFRHSRATHLAKDLTEQQLKVYLGWTAGSAMAATYVHLSGKDVDDAILKINGMEVEEKTNNNILKITKCPRCKEIQGSSAQFCFKCGYPLTNEAMNTEKTVETELLKLIEESGLITEVVKKIQTQLNG